MGYFQFIILFCFISFLGTGIAHSAPLMYRQQQMKSQRQRQQQEEYLQYQQQQQQEQQQGAQTQNQQAVNAEQAYQQSIAQRNQAIAQAILNSHNQSVSNQIQQVNNNAGINQPPDSQTFGSVTGPAVQQQNNPSSSNSSDVKDEVDLSDVWKKLDNKSTVWTILMDDQSKLMTISEYISRFQQEGVKIIQSPQHYMHLIDQVAQQNPQMLDKPFGELIKILAIIDYDFDNGMDKDDLAKKVLGDAGFEENKKRFTQQANNQQ